MTIVCGIDFSDRSAAAGRVAAAMAARLGLRLKLVHVVDARLGTEAPPEIQQGPHAFLAEEAGRLHARFAVDVEAIVVHGHADEVLVDLATSLGARVLTVGSVGARKQQRWLLGSIAERVAQASRVPVLVVRDGARLLDWASGNASLRVMVGVEPTPGALAALRWAQGLREVGPCSTVIAQIVWPAQGLPRVGISTPLPLEPLGPDLAQSALENLRHWAGEWGTPADTSFVVQPGWGRVDGHLTELAADSAVDLLVVGSHQRAGIARLWQGSVSRGVLHHAPMSVACVPAAALPSSLPAVA